MATVASHMEIVVHGRNVVVPEHYRQHVAEKLVRLERYDHKITRVDVELQHERNPRQTGSCQHIEITCRTRGPAVRAEACAEDFYKALDMAADKLDRRFRHAADRRRVHHGRRTPPTLGAVPADLDPLTPGAAVAPSNTAPAAAAEEGVDESEHAGPGQVVRVKEHPAKPMTVDQALFEMELVGHDFFLFSDVDTGRPSVIYRRHAYDYGLIRLGDTGD